MQSRSTRRLLSSQATATLILLREVACFAPASTKCTLHVGAFSPSLVAPPQRRGQRILPWFVQPLAAMPQALGSLRGGAGGVAKRSKSGKTTGEGNEPRSSKRPRRAAAAAAAAGKGNNEDRGSGADTVTVLDDRGEALAKNVSIALAAERNPRRADDMTRYMKGHFPHFGIDATRRRAIVKGVLDIAGGPKSLTEEEVRSAVRAAYEMPEREAHHFAVDLCRSRPDAFDLDQAKQLITTKSWWDSVDMLACHLVGPIVLRNKQIGTAEMREWLTSDNMWVRRSSILHQLAFSEEESNPELLFHSCEVLAHEQEFFIRKAIGWALRSYARIDGTAVVDYCNSMGDRLSPLSRKEALKHASTPGRNFKIQ